MEQSLLSKNMIGISDNVYFDHLSLLGEGRFGKVYKGWMKSQNKECAIKIFQENIDRPLQIKQIRAYLQLKEGHPNLLKCYDYISKEGDLYLILEYCRGGNLKDYIEKIKLKKQKLSQFYAMLLFGDLMQGMIFLNSKNFIHRDLKPQNILLVKIENQLCLKIGDLGLARKINQQMTNSLMTIIYASPQLLHKQQYNQKTDVWSAGLILFQLLTQDQLNKDIYQVLGNFAGINRLIIINQFQKKFGKQWYELLCKMLTSKCHERPSFSQLLPNFNNAKVKVMNETIQNIKFKIYKTLFFDQLIFIIKKIKKSRYLKMHMYIIIIVSQKLLQIYLKQLYKQIISMKISLQYHSKQKINYEEFIKILKQYSQKVYSKINDCEIIIRELSDKIQKRTKDKTIEQKQVLQKISIQTGQNIFAICSTNKIQINSINYYEQFFKKIINTDNIIYWPSKKWKYLNQSDKALYLTIRIIANLNSIIKYSELKQYLQSLKTGDYKYANQILEKWNRKD